MPFITGFVVSFTTVKVLESIFTISSWSNPVNRESTQEPLVSNPLIKVKTIITYATSYFINTYMIVFNAITNFYFSIQSAAGAIGASRNLRRFGQSIKRVVREVKDAENLEAAGIKLAKSIAFL